MEYNRPPSVLNSAAGTPKSVASFYSTNSNMQGFSPVCATPRTPPPDMGVSRMTRLKNKISFWKPKPVTLKTVVSEIESLEASFKRHRAQTNTTMNAIRQWADYIKSVDHKSKTQAPFESSHYDYYDNITTADFAEWLNLTLNEVEKLAGQQASMAPIYSGFNQCFTSLHQAEDNCHRIFKQRCKVYHELQKSIGENRSQLHYQLMLLNDQLDAAIRSFRTLADLRLTAEVSKLTNCLDNLYTNGVSCQRRIDMLNTNRKTSITQYSPKLPDSPYSMQLDQDQFDDEFSSPVPVKRAEEVLSPNSSYMKREVLMMNRQPRYRREIYSPSQDGQSTCRSRSSVQEPSQLNVFPTPPLEEEDDMELDKPVPDESMETISPLGPAPW